MRTVYEETISHRSVIDSTGRLVGEVDGEVVDTESWRVEALRVKLHRDVAIELGAPHPPLRAARLEVPVGFVSDVTDTILLRGPVSALKSLDERQESGPL